MPKQENNKNIDNKTYTEGLDPAVTQTGIGKAENNALKKIKNKPK